MLNVGGFNEEVLYKHGEFSSQKQTCPYIFLIQFVQNMFSNRIDSRTTFSTLMRFLTRTSTFLASNSMILWFYFPILYDYVMDYEYSNTFLPLRNRYTLNFTCFRFKFFHLLFYLFVESYRNWTPPLSTWRVLNINGTSRQTLVSFLHPGTF